MIRPHHKTIKLAFIIFFLYMMPVYADQTLIINPNTISFNLEANRPQLQNIVFENHGDKVLNYSLELSDSLTNIIVIDKINIMINPNSIETIGVRVLTDREINITTGYIFIKEGGIVLNRIGVAINYINTSLPYSTKLGEVSFKALNEGLIATFIDIRNYLFSYYWNPKVPGIYNFLFLRITLFISFWLFFIATIHYSELLRSRDGKVLVYLIIFPFISLVLVLLFPTL